jgi:hypothetical protein
MIILALEFPAISLVIFCLLKPGRRISLMILVALETHRKSRGAVPLTKL